MKYVYPAVFHAEPEGGYTISFPDIEGCLSQGETIQECCEMAEDALTLMLWDMEENHISAPSPTEKVRYKSHQEDAEHPAVA